ncbi:ubiquinone biosynthesis regulatory protein kinase UbiB [Candidatus Curculioniphilus buchneri]|uniref:ubiquinone biosynthesis regulatory protein kinase UbiB n=1 Tax=Candidatus Curculioniphilus buchneri TaxID=690594 RepID=UPI00376EE048
MLHAIRRLYMIMHIVLSYGLDEFLPKARITLFLRFGKKLFFWIPNNHFQYMKGERLRLALQELGPLWIKFGQMLSTRRDLLPLNIANQLAMLQAKVAPFEGILARSYIEESMERPLETWFDNFQNDPLASASIAQVHSARLKNGKEVVIKIIRPNVVKTIQEDLRLMFWLARWISRLFPERNWLRPTEIVLEYEKILLNELNLLRETANAIQLRRNFKESTILYIPEVYPNYCSKNMLVMERIYGIPINDIEALEKQGTNMKLLAERGVEIFFTQVFRDGLFHGDMHPGNIFVSFKHPESPQYIGIDYGIVGTLNKENKLYLAKNFIAFFNRNYRKVAELHIDSNWVPPNTNIEDFEFAIRVVCEPIFEKPLSEISFGHLLLNLFNTARHFNMEIQPQLILLQKTLLYVEGIGRQLYPQLDLWKTAKPFLENWIKDQVGLMAVLRTLKENMPFWIENLPELPDLVYDGLKQNRLLQKNVQSLIEEVKIHHIQYRQSYFLFGVGTILTLSGIFLLIHNAHKYLLSTVLITVGFIIWIYGWKYINNQH